MTRQVVTVSDAGGFSLWLEPFNPAERLGNGPGEHILSECGSRMTARALASLLNEMLKLADDEGERLPRIRIAHAVAKVLGGSIDIESFR